MIVIPIINGALSTVIRRLVQGLEDAEVGGCVEKIQTTALMRSVEILRRVLETWGNILSLILQRKTLG